MVNFEEFDDDFDDFDDEEDELFLEDKLDRNIFRTLHGHGVSSAVEYEVDGKICFDHRPNSACWNFMRTGMQPYAKKEITPINFYSCLHTGPGYEGVNRPYWNFLFDKDKSPWRSLLKEGQSFDWVSPVGLDKMAAAKSPYSFARIPISKETNMQTLVSLLIAARVGADNPMVLNMFTKLTEDGWPEVDALYVTTYAGLDLQGNIIDMTMRDYYAFTARYNNIYDRFKNGTPNPDPKRIFGSDYGFLQGIWFDEKYDSSKTADQLPPTKFAEIAGHAPRKYDGMFPKRFRALYPSRDTMPMKSMKSYKDIVKMREEIINAVTK